MRHVIFADQPVPSYKVAILIKENALDKTAMNYHYVAKLGIAGISIESIIGFNLKHNEKGVASAALIKEYLAVLLPAVKSLSVEYLLVTDGTYFKTLTGMRKVDPYYGYCLPCVLKGYESLKIILAVNYRMFFHNPAMETKLELALDTLIDNLQGVSLTLGADVIHSANYPVSTLNIALALESLHKYPMLTCDIETFSLSFFDAGIGSIAFAWDQHNGTAFTCDYLEASLLAFGEATVLKGTKSVNSEVRSLLRNFFETYQGTLVWHNANFDLKVIIYTLWMEDDLDIEGLIKGMQLMSRSFHDTKIIAYLATNTTAGNKLGLKELAHSFTGNYAQDDIKDIRKISKTDLLKYNLTDCLATWYVYNTYYQIMIQDNQLDIYQTIMLPSVKTILQMELTGMPMDKQAIKDAKSKLQAIATVHKNFIKASSIIKGFTKQLRNEELVKKNLLLKKTVKQIEDFDHIEFNPGSPLHLQKLLYSHLNHDVEKTTDTGQPATGAKILKHIMTKLIATHSIIEAEYLD